MNRDGIDVAMTRLLRLVANMKREAGA